MTPLSSTGIAPARTLGEGDLALGWSAGLSATTAELASIQEGEGRQVGPAVALGSAGFFQAVDARWGWSDRIELGARAGVGSAAIVSRFAIVRPDDGWDVTAGVTAWGALAAPDGGRHDLAIESFALGGGSLTLAVGRTWSDFLSVWLATHAELGAYELEAMLGGDDASGSGVAARTGGTLGLRVGFRRFFVGVAMTAAFLAAETDDGWVDGLLLQPAFGLSWETR